VEKGVTVCGACGAMLGRTAGAPVIVGFVICVAVFMAALFVARSQTPPPRAPLQLLELAIIFDHYADDWGAYPPAPQPQPLGRGWLGELQRPDGSRYIDSEDAAAAGLNTEDVYRDQKGRQLHYQCPGTAHPDKFDLWPKRD
jgi:hypothetical protein